MCHASPLIGVGITVGSPCTAYRYVSAKRNLNNLYYVITDKGPYVYRRDFGEPCCSGCCSSGHDHHKLAWVQCYRLY